jgi:hypothetical protein
MARTAFVVSLALLVGACSSDDAKPDGLVGDVGTVQDKGTPTPDGPKLEALPPSNPGTVCTQQNKTCPAGQTCAFLEAWNAPKGTCLTELKDGCKSYNDQRCVVAGANYSVMCGPYSINNVATNVCFLLCVMNGINHDCPPQHTCKDVNGYKTCIPQ